MFLFDYILILLCLFSALIFLWKGEGYLYKLYLGCIFGFLFFLVINFQIELIENVYARESLTFLQSFLLEHKDILLNITLFSLLLWGILFMLHPALEIKGDASIFGPLLFGSAFPFFLLGIFSYISENSSEFAILQKLLGFLGKSSFLDFLSSNPHWIFLGLLGLLFYKFLWSLVLALMLLLGNRLRDIIFGDSEDEPEEKEEEPKHPRRKRHFWE